MCALLYDDDDCGGWEYQVPRGYSELSWGITGPRKNDAESVLVRKGCRFIGRTPLFNMWNELLKDPILFRQATTTQTGMTFRSVETL